MLGAAGLRTHIWNNNLKSLALLAGFPVLLILIGYAFALVFAALGGGGAYYGKGYGLEGDFAAAWDMMPVIIPVALGAAAIWFAIAWFSHQAIIDAATGAHKVSRAEEKRLYNLLENLCISRGITMPHLRIIETPAMNAYASGLTDKHYAVTVTRGLMNGLNDAEVEAVLAHELSHIRHRDVRMLVIAVIFAGIISFAVQAGLRGFLRGAMFRAGRGRRGGGGNAAILILIAFAILAIAYVLALVIRFSLSRRREYMADAGAVELTKNPDAMIAALEKISGRAEIEKAPSEVREMFIENPREAGFAGMFATHPPIEKRIEALVRYAGGRRRERASSIPAV
ncbi:MAG: M48 family metallopeptidase [Maricaulaceae bacterium]|nr:M48 family metallopeptidase [Maricaulaceae bacterium]